MPRDDQSSDGAAASTDPDEQRHEVRLEAPDSEPVSATVTEAVSEVTGKDLRELRPLHDVVDPEALDSLCSPSVDADERLADECRVTFRYEGQRIRVVAGERIVLAPVRDE